MKIKKIMLQNNVYIILGQRGAGKSLFASCIAKDYKEVFVNYNLYVPGVKVNIFRDYTFLRKLEYKEEKRLIIVDEGGINFNSREFQREENKMI
jgi:predicted AAA+ superfamily ATPase